MVTVNKMGLPKLTAYRLWMMVTGIGVSDKPTACIFGIKSLTIF
jgi:hypothetical protein